MEENTGQMMLTRDALEACYAQTFDAEAFKAVDPCGVVHELMEHTNRQLDIEIGGLMVAMISWGSRKAFRPVAQRMLRDEMRWHPADFIMNEEYESSFPNAKNGCVYRTLNVDRFKAVCRRLRSALAGHTTMEEVFEGKPTKEVVAEICTWLQDAKVGTMDKSACKRVCMFVRWMTRTAAPDFGIWTSRSQSDLYAVMDTHVLQLTQPLLKNKRPTWKACEELTSIFKQWDSNDPLKYDIALMTMADTPTPTLPLKGEGKEKSPTTDASINKSNFKSPLSGEVRGAFPSPCYVMEERLLRRNLRIISDVARKADVEIILAFKAFALWKSFPIFREYIAHSTASSLFEARLAVEEFGNKAHTYSPAYTEAEIDEIARCSSHITFNSLTQYERFHHQVKSVSDASIGLRVNPEYSEIETELYNPCAPGSRFGVLAADLPEQLPTDIEGFHIHCHCESGSDTFARTLTHIEDKFGKWLPQLKWINFGGGHLMTRADYDTQLLIDTLNAFHARYPWLKVVLEPGSAFAWQTGPLIASVVDIVCNAGVRTAILNVSFTCHTPDCLEMPYKPAVRGAKTLEADDLDTARRTPHTYRLGGNSCLSGDFMGLWQFDHDLELGETIIFEDMIHYTTVKTCMFNGIGHPSIGMLKEDGTFQLFRKYEYEDYRDRMC